MAKKGMFAENPGMIFILSYLVLFAVDIAVLWLANSFFPKQVVFGTVNLSPTWAMLHTTGVLALLGTFGIPVAREIERWKGRPLKPGEWMVKYFILNFAALWLLSRFNDGFGFGLSAWWVVAALAAALDFAQGLAMMRLEKMRLSL